MAMMETGKKLELLKKMKGKMPQKAMDDDMFEMEDMGEEYGEPSNPKAKIAKMKAMEAEETPEEEAAESPEEQEEEMELGIEEHNPALADASDDDILAEMKRRKLKV